MPKGIPYQVKLNDNFVSVREYCRIKNLNYTGIMALKNKESISYEEAICRYETNNIRHTHIVELNGIKMTIKEYCKIKNLSYWAIINYKQDHPNLTYQEILEYYTNKRGKKSKRLFNLWQGMHQRCYNSHNARFNNYGGRGIIVCDTWHDYFNFEKDMYESYQKHVEEYGEKDTTLDRIDVNGNYCKENCRWATNKEQANNKSTNIFVPTGETLFNYCNRMNLNYNTIRGRLRAGWTIEDALNIPTQKSIILPTGETIKQYCDKVGLNINTVQNRLKKGWSLEKALKLNSQRKYKYILKDGTPLAEYCRQNNLKYEAIRRRIARGWTIEDALTKPLKQ